MDERNTSLLVDSLQSKVEKLIIQHKKAKEDIKQLKDENLFLQNKLSETKIQLTDVNEQNKVLNAFCLDGVKAHKCRIFVA